MIEKIKQKLRFAFIGYEPISLKSLAVLRQEIDIFVIKYGHSMLIEELVKDGWHCYTKNGEYRVCKNRASLEDYIRII